VSLVVVVAVTCCGLFVAAPGRLAGEVNASVLLLSASVVIAGTVTDATTSPEEIEAGARALLAQTRGHQLAEARRQLGLGQRDIAATMGVSGASISQIEHGDVTSFDVIARYVEALGAASTSSPTSPTGPSSC
jgi:DNA-binding XRE family transcriptional regulator